MRIGDTLYFDHQATTPIDEGVLAEMIPYFGESFGNPHSIDHKIGWCATRAVEDALGKVAQIIGADSDEIVFTSGATEANNLAIVGLGRRCARGKRRRILVSAVEHKSVLAPIRILEEQLGYRVQYLPVDEEGYVRPTILKDVLDDQVLFVSIMAVNNEVGTIEGISEYSEIVRESGAFLHCDAAQAPCAVDVGGFAKLVDLLSLSSHKMYGPQGIGALYVRRGLHQQIEPLIWGGGQQGNLRSGTLPLALCAGMGAAAARLEPETMRLEQAQIRTLTDTLIGLLTELPWNISLNGPAFPNRHPANANMCFRGFNAKDILYRVQPHLAASTGSACTSGIPEPSHVLRAMGLSADDAESSIRFSIGRTTTDQDILDCVRIIRESLSHIEETE